MARRGHYAHADPSPPLAHVAPTDPKLLKRDKIQPPHPLFGLVWINPKRVSGSPCFYGTRVPIKNLPGHDIRTTRENRE